MKKGWKCECCALELTEEAAKTMGWCCPICEISLIPFDSPTEDFEEMGEGHSTLPINSYR